MGPELNTTQTGNWWDVIPTISGQYFNTRTAEATAQPRPAAAPVLPANVTASLQQYLPLILLAVVGVIVFRIASK